jgi:hypothetical protein
MTARDARSDALETAGDYEEGCGVALATVTATGGMRWDRMVV